jgi:hypothetical protein
VTNLPSGVPVDAFRSALDGIVTLAPSSPTGWGLLAFAVAWTLFCAAMLHAFLRNDSRRHPETLNARAAREVEEARS